MRKKSKKIEIENKKNPGGNGGGRVVFRNSPSCGRSAQSTHGVPPPKETVLRREILGRAFARTTAV